MTVLEKDPGQMSHSCSNAANIFFTKHPIAVDYLFAFPTLNLLTPI
jgi:hypothetical protein